MRTQNKLLAGLLLIGLSAAALASPRPAERVLVLGDSLSAAYNMPVEAGWVALLQRRLKNQGCDAVVINASISGETSHGGAARLPALLEAHHPTIVMVVLGANDGLRGLDLGAMEERLGQMVTASREAGAKPLLVQMRIPENYGARYARAFAAVFEAVKIAHEVPLLPFLLEAFATDLSMFQPDTIHPTASAQPLILDTVWRHLAPHLEGCSGRD